jgi:surface polysaccharide O-acyltransferase-like enzyme
LFGLIPAEPGRLPQYLSLFVIGIVAGRGNWFTSLDHRIAAIWFVVGAAVFSVAAATGLPRLALGTAVGPNMLWAGLEAFVGVGLILGLLVVFRLFMSAPDPWSTRLSGNVYGVYLVHIFIVIGLQVALLGFDWPALAKFGVVTLAALILSFALVALIRRIPGVRAVL